MKWRPPLDPYLRRFILIVNDGAPKSTNVSKPLDCSQPHLLELDMQQCRHHYAAKEAEMPNPQAWRAMKTTQNDMLKFAVNSPSYLPTLPILPPRVGVGVRPISKSRGS